MKSGPSEPPPYQPLELSVSSSLLSSVQPLPSLHGGRHWSYDLLSFLLSPVASDPASRSHGLRSVSLLDYGRSSLSFRLQPRPMRLSVCRAAKPGTVKKVCEIVRKQLALPDDSKVDGESKFAALGADSLDTVEIVMGLEEEFGITVEEDSAQTITTVQEVADLIEDLVEKNGA